MDNICYLIFFFGCYTVVFKTSNISDEILQMKIILFWEVGYHLFHEISAIYVLDRFQVTKVKKTRR